MPSMTDFLAELTWRGLLQDRSEGLEERLASGPISAYVGFDASGPSLHPSASGRCVRSSGAANR